jgi:hypothetical protein
MRTVEITHENCNKASCCDCGLSGIFPANNYCNPLLKKDSGEAAMTEAGQGYV